MKYGFIFIIIITTMFGGVCIGAVKMSQDYIEAQRSGCCSRHGGVSYCGQSGYYICADGTRSKSCRCR